MWYIFAESDKRMCIVFRDNYLCALISFFFFPKLLSWHFMKFSAELNQVLHGDEMYPLKKKKMLLLKVMYRYVKGNFVQRLNPLRCELFRCIAKVLTMTWWKRKKVLSYVHAAAYCATLAYTYYTYIGVVYFIQYKNIIYYKCIFLVCATKELLCRPPFSQSVVHLLS